MKFLNFSIEEGHVEVSTDDGSLFVQLPLTADSQNTDEQGNEISQELAEQASDYVLSYYNGNGYEAGSMAKACASGFKDFTSEYCEDAWGKEYFRITEKDGDGVALIKEHRLANYYNIYLFDTCEEV